MPVRFPALPQTLHRLSFLLKTPDEMIDRRMTFAEIRRGANRFGNEFFRRSARLVQIFAERQFCRNPRRRGAASSGRRGSFDKSRLENMQLFSAGKKIILRFARRACRLD